MSLQTRPIARTTPRPKYPLPPRARRSLEQRRASSSREVRSLGFSLPKGTPRYVLLIALFLGAQVLFCQSSIFRIHSIYVAGNHHVSNKEVVARLGVALDQPLWKFKPKALAQKLVEMRDFDQATVSFSLPGRIEVNLVERIPVLQVASRGRHQHWFAVDADGIFLHALPRGDANLPRLVVEERVNLESRLHPKVLHDLAQAIRTISAQMPQQVWYYSLDRRGHIALRTFANRHPFNVQLGEMNNLDYKMNLLHALMKQTPKELIPLNVDLRFNSPIVRFLNPPPVKTEQTKA